MRLATPFAALLLPLLASAQAPAAKLKLLSFKPGHFDAREAELPQSIPRYDLPANRLVFDQRDVRLVLQGAFDERDEVYRINGLLNPDIQIPVGTKLTIMAVNVGLRGSGGRPMTFLTGKSLSYLSRPLLGSWNARRMVNGVHGLPLLPISQQPNTLYDVKLVYLAQSAGVTYWGPIGWVKPGCYGRIIVVP